MNETSRPTRAHPVPGNRRWGRRGLHASGLHPSGPGSHGAVRSSRVPIWATACALVLLQSIAIAPVRAQALPVTDVPNLTLEVVHNLNQDGLTADVVFKVLQIYITMRRLDDLAWRDVNAPLDAMRTAAQASDALGYGRSDLAALFAETFPGTAGYADSWYLEKRDVVRRLAHTGQNYAANLQRHHALWKAAQTELNRYRADLEAMLGPQEAYDVLLTLGVFEADEWRLMRQLMMQELTLHAALESDAVNEEIQRARTLWTSLTGAPRPPE